MAVKNEERYSHLPKVKTSVAAPLKNAKAIITQALEKSENVEKKEYAGSVNSSHGTEENEKKALKLK